MSIPSPYRRPSYAVARHGARSGPVEYDQDPAVAPEIRRSALWVRLVVGGLAFVAVVVTALLGGFDQVGSDDADTLPVVAVDEEFNGGPWLVTVESAQIGRKLRDHSPKNDGDLVLQVNVRITKIDNCACDVLDAITLKGAPVRQDALTAGEDARPETVRSLRDNSLTLQAQIGLPVRLAYLWEVAEGTPVPKEITVVIHGAIRRYQNFRFLGTTIEEREPKATVAVPVVDRTGSA